MYKLISGELPFKQPNLKEKIMEEEVEFFGSRWAGVSTHAKNFIQKLLEKSPTSRMTAKKSLEHPFF